MQFSPPLYDPPFTNYGQFYPYSHPVQCQPTYPEIIGEGDVASIVLPDGSVHLYFIPVNKPNTSCPCRISNGVWNNNMTAYYVRSVSNPVTPAVFNQQYQKMYGVYPRPYPFSNCCIGEPSPGFQLKFHNDCWTSTTDLHYFFPLICENVSPVEHKRSASVQVDIPIKVNTENREGPYSARHCLCWEAKQHERSEDTPMNKCALNKTEYGSSRSGSSISNKRSKTSLRSRSKNKKRQGKNTDTIVTCKCSNTKDKSVTTYTEQSTSMPVDQEQKTQTCPSWCKKHKMIRNVNSFTRNHGIKPEIWIPKTELSKNSNESRSLKMQGYNSGYSSMTCSCSTSDIDLD